jgi:hypothetical protein
VRKLLLAFVATSLGCAALAGKTPRERHQHEYEVPPPSPADPPTDEPPHAIVPPTTPVVFTRVLAAEDLADSRYAACHWRAYSYTPCSGIQVAAREVHICDECTTDVDCGGGRRCMPATTLGMDAVPVNRCMDASSACATGCGGQNRCAIYDDDQLQCAAPPTPCMLP